MVNLGQRPTADTGPLEVHLPPATWGARLRQLFTYMMIGGSSTLVDMLLFNLLFWLWEPTSAPHLALLAAAAYLGSCVNAYQGHRRWTFRGAEVYKARFWAFMALNGAGLLLNAALVTGLAYALPLAVPLTPLEAANIAKLLAAGGSGLFSFLGNKHWVFRA